VCGRPTSLNVLLSRQPKTQYPHRLGTHTSAIPWPLYPSTIPFSFIFLWTLLRVFALTKSSNSSILKRFRTLYQKHWWRRSRMPFLSRNSNLLYLPPVTATRHQPPVTKRCIIPSREHPPERSRMPRPGLPHRKRNHHARILSAFADALVNACNQKSIAIPS